MPPSRCNTATNEVSILRPRAFYCLFGLLSVSGMRLFEALNLELRDVDLTEGPIDDPRCQVWQRQTLAIACFDLQGAR